MPSLVTRNPCLILAGVLAGLALTAPAAHAATFTVTKTADTVDGTCGADCSLREAVIAANAAAGADVVQVPAGTFALALPGAEDAAQTGDLDVLAAGGTLRVQGAGAGQTTIDADQLDRAFEVRAGARLELADATVTDGAGDGSAVLVGQFGQSASLDVARSAITLHRKQGNAIRGNGNAVITISDSAFTGNGADPAGPDAVFGGAAVFLNDAAEATISGSTFTNNRASFGGGAIYVNNSSKLTLGSSTFSQNHANFGGGALWNQNDARSTVTSSTFTGNTASFGGAAIFNQNDATLDVASSALTQNTAGAPADQAGGGAIFNQNQAVLTVTDTTITGNTAHGRGGALYNQNDGSVTLTRTTVAGNRSLPIGGAASDLDGGGAVFAWNQAVTTLVNTTVSGNETSAYGGAVLISNQAQVRATNATISGNTAAAGGGMLWNRTFPALPTDPLVQLANTIVAGNLAAGLPDSCAGPAPATVLVSLGHNIENPFTCGTPAAGDLTADPQLGPLVANGGPTLTQAIAAASPAKDGAEAARCPATDQRGVARPQGPGCDIGAFELEAAPPPPPPPPAPAPPPAARPAAVTFSALVRLPSARKCVSRRLFRIRLRAPKGVKVTSAEVRVNRKRVKTVKGRRLTAPVDLRNLPKGRFTVEIRIRLADGRTIRGTRRYRTCAPKRRSTGKVKV